MNEEEAVERLIKLKERFERHERFSRQIDIEVLEYVIADYESKEGIEEDE